MQRTHFIVMLAAGLVVAACGKKDNEGAAPGGAKDPGTAPVAAAPKLDCEAIATKAIECREPMLATYTGTRRAKLVGGGDGAAGAKTLSGMLHEQSLVAKELCGGEMGWSRMPAIATALGACDLAAACDVWGPCAATAIGENGPGI
jgi:hypothetical protein